MIRRLLDLFYPPLCELCREVLSDGRSLCDTCAGDLKRIETPYCQKCGEAFEGQIEGDFSCPNCANVQLDFDFARSPLHAAGPARELVHALKYRSRFYLSDELGPFFMELLENDERLQNLPKDSLIIPVPLHWWRQQVRQGNQAHELAKAFSTLSGHILFPALQRVRRTETQTRLTRKQRLSNLHNAFRIREKMREKLAGKTVILIDDVFTTGSTAHECARLLKKKGPVERVIVLTLLRG